MSRQRDKCLIPKIPQFSLGVPERQMAEARCRDDNEVAEGLFFLSFNCV